MTFEVSPDFYTRFMGRFSEPLAVQFVELADVRHGQRALDVGCGPGALTSQLVSRLGADAVTAIDPSAPFVTAIGERFPGVDVRTGVAEQLPYPDRRFDRALSQLVVQFMSDPVSGLREMARVTRPGGVIAACVWDHAGGRSPLTPFWRAVRDVDPRARTEERRAGAREGELAELAESAGLTGVESTDVTVTVRFPTFLDWWEPFTLGVGPAGAYVASLDQERRDALRDRCERELPAPPFELTAAVWCVRAHP
jgi:SAM-dependent methyltransferase